MDNKPTPQPAGEEPDLTEEELDELYAPVARFTEDTLTYEARLREYQAKRRRPRRKR